ncbi:MAG: hypothetical protein HY225_03670 [Candidatus Vogelbacteria bacterium]|nr:hypothetical protein [Candidatus Vogelbacteria bacterium]
MDSKKIITILIIVAGASLVVGLFIYYGGSRSGVSGGLQTVAPLSTADSNALSQDFLVALSSLNSLELNSAFFDDKIFRNLVDYSKDIKDEDLGRENPFLPVGDNVTPVSQTTSAAQSVISSPKTVVIPPVVNKK